MKPTRKRSLSPLPVPLPEPVIRLTIKELKLELALRGISTDTMLYRLDLEKALHDNPIQSQSKIPKRFYSSSPKSSASPFKPIKHDYPYPPSFTFGKQGEGGELHGPFKGFNDVIFHINKAENGRIEVVGKGTFDRRQVLRRVGGKWDPKIKSWIFLDTIASCKTIQTIMSNIAPVIEEEKPRRKWKGRKGRYFNEDGYFDDGDGGDYDEDDYDDEDDDEAYDHFRGSR